MPGFRSFTRGASSANKLFMPDTNSASKSPQHEPLSMTVHTLSVPGDDSPRNTAGRWKMIAVLLVCAAPVIASYVTYYVIRPEGRRNYGELITPQRPLPAITTVDLNGKPGELPMLKNQWLLISVASSDCDTACQKRLYFQRQLRESLGKEKVRVDWIWLVTDPAAIDARLKPALLEATVLRVPAAALAQWLQPASNQRVEEHLFVVDPLGNLMMRFPANMDAAGAGKAKRDLDRLLRASGSWDKEGR